VGWGGERGGGGGGGGGARRTNDRLVAKSFTCCLKRDKENLEERERERE